MRLWPRVEIADAGRTRMAVRRRPSSIMSDVLRVTKLRNAGASSKIDEM